MFKKETISADFSASLVVFFVALPLCLGIALASGAPIVSGLIAGIIGGIVVGFLSGSHTSVSGPAAGLTFEVPFNEKKSTIGLDYSYRLTNPFGGTHTFGLRMNL
jgi:MFS superfamily sulfate permease-like transporter